MMSVDLMCCGTSQDSVPGFQPCPYIIRQAEVADDAIPLDTPIHRGQVVDLTRTPSPEPSQYTGGLMTTVTESQHLRSYRLSVPCAQDRAQIICDQCRQKFTRASSLKRHRQTCLARVRGSSDRHACKHCSTVCTRKDLLARHVKLKHEKVLETCLSCKRSFREDYLKLHVRTCKGTRLEVVHLRYPREARRPCNAGAGATIASAIFVQ